MTENAPVVIIGTGLAGYSLAREFRKLDAETPLLMITRDDGHSYSKPMLSTGFTKGKDADGLSMADPAKMATQLKASIRTMTEVTRIDPENKQLDLDQETISYQKLILATGAHVNRLTFPGSDDARVVSINDLMDYRHFRVLVEGKQRILIMGAGLIGCEYANDLIRGGYQVTLVDPAITPLNGLVPAFAGQVLRQGLESAGATFHMETSVSRLEDNNGTLLAKLADGNEVMADLVISAVGLRPDLSLARQTGIETNRGIITNRFLETNFDDIYALGDAAEVDGHVLLYVLPLMACARALAKTLAGERTSVSYGVMPVATKTPACPVVVSPPLTEDGTWEVEQDGLNTRGLFYDKDRQLLGFVLTGDYVSEKQSLSKLASGIHS